MEKITMKEQVLRFVEAKGSARFTDIQEFIVDTNYGKGTYQNGYQIVRERKHNSKTGEWIEVLVKRNTNRGYYCSAFRQVSTSRFTTKLPVGYFMRGDNRLEKIGRGIYITIRG